MSLRTLCQKFFLFVSLALFAVACSKEEFSARQNKSTTPTNPVTTSSNSACTNFTLVRPKVDLLFLWDNSTSSLFINSTTKAALNSLINNVSNNFDYHMVMAPLIKVGGRNDYMKLVSYDTQGLNSSALSYRVDKSQAANNLSFPNAQGSFEDGLERARDLIHYNQSNGIFRQGAYQIIVLMSSEDDNSYFSGSYPSSYQRSLHVNRKVHELLCLRGNYNYNYGSNYSGVYSSSCSGAPSLNSPMMRFLSVVANNKDRCSANGIQFAKEGVAYEMAASKIYSAPYSNNISSPDDQNGRPIQQRGVEQYNLFDSTDICQNDFAGIFDGVNSAIQMTLIRHKYRYWPVTASSEPFDENSINVTKDGVQINRISDNVNVIRDLTGESDTDTFGFPINGYRLVSNFSTFNTRYFPSVGEPFTGRVIELFGSAKAIHPQCLNVTFQDKPKYFGYCVLTNGRPFEPSIRVFINGSEIPKGGSNGWELVTSGGSAFGGSLNIRVKGPGDTSPETPAENRNGFFVRLGPNAVYQSGQSCSVTYAPAGN